MKPKIRPVLQYNWVKGKPALLVFDKRNPYKLITQIRLNKSQVKALEEADIDSGS